MVLVDQRAHSLHGGRDNVGGALDDGGRGGLKVVFGEQFGEARDVALDELGVERDGGERVLNLMRDAACDLFPGTLLLRVQQLGGVFQNEHVTEVVTGGACCGLQQGDRRGEVQDAGAGLHLHLGRSGAHAVGAAQQAVERVNDLGGQHVVQAKADELLLAAGVQHLREGAVGEHDLARCGERDDAVGDGFDDGLEFGAALLQGSVDLRELGRGACGNGVHGFEVRGHRIEAGHKLA